MRPFWARDLVDARDPGSGSLLASLSKLLELIVLFNELVVTPLGDELTLLEQVDDVAVFDGLQAMRNQDRGFPAPP